MTFPIIFMWTSGYYISSIISRSNFFSSKEERDGDRKRKKKLLKIYQNSGNNLNKRGGRMKGLNRALNLSKRVGINIIT